MSSHAPLIGISTSELRLADRVAPTPQGEPPRRELALGLSYVRAIERAGGLPVVLPPMGPEAAGPLLDRLSGLCLPGGPDLHPSCYGEAPGRDLGPTEPELDRFELALARRADARGMPVLAICRGAQVLNVARGGTLHQHLPHGAGAGSVRHRQSEPPSWATHGVAVSEGSLLRRCLGEGQLRVNSFHHQAVKRLGGGLRAVAWAPDGVPEAVEASEHPFLVGVQWHAEGLVGHPEQDALFRRFVEAAAARSGAVDGARSVHAARAA